MWGFLSVVIICATLLIWSYRYCAPYTKPEVQEGIHDVDDKEIQQMSDLDDVIKEIYGRLDD